MAVKTTRDGRLIYDRYSYRKLREQKYKEQSESCAACGEFTEFWNWELHHVDGRGLGGGRRDDSRVIGLCSQCHQRQDKKVLHFGLGK